MRIEEGGLLEYGLFLRSGWMWGTGVSLPIGAGAEEWTVESGTNSTKSWKRWEMAAYNDIVACKRDDQKSGRRVRND